MGNSLSSLKQLRLMIPKLITKILFIINVTEKCVNFSIIVQRTALKSSQISHTGAAPAYNDWGKQTDLDQGMTSFLRSDVILNFKKFEIR